MFDNLRDDAAESLYGETEAEFFPEGEAKPIPVAPPRKTGGKFLGMTPVQRFIIAVMLMIAVCTLGTMFLLITGKIGLM